MQQNLDAFLVYICKRYTDWNNYGYNTGSASQWGDHWRSIRNEFAAKISIYKPWAQSQIQACENKLALNESEWRRTGQNSTGVNFAEWMKTFIQKVLPPVYLTLLGAYDVKLNPLNGDPNFDVTITWGQPRRRKWYQKILDNGFQIPVYKAQF